MTVEEFEKLIITKRLPPTDDGDGMIVSIELAAYLKKYSIRCSMDFFND
jgi:hypothetical protein